MDDAAADTRVKLNIADLLMALLSWRKTLLIVVFTCTLVGLVIAFSVPRYYKSVTRVLPPKESNVLSGLSGLSSLVRSLPGGIARFGKVDDEYDLIALLRSRTVMEAIVHKFDLIRVYAISDSSMEKTIRELKDNTEIDWTEDNTLEVRVWDEDAVRAADIANTYIEILNRRNYELRSQEAHNTRIFLEQRVAQNRQDLAKAESALQKYQEKEKMIVPMDPSAAGISSLAELFASKVKKEMELAILERSVGTDNAEYRQRKLELGILLNQIDRLPEIGMGSLRLYREVAIQQKIMELLVPLYEQAKVNENKDIPVAYVLDNAIPSERPDRPKRIFIVGIATFLGIVFCFCYIGFQEYRRTLKIEDPGQYQRYQELGAAMRSGKKNKDVHLPNA